MARMFSRLTAVRHGWKGGGIYLVTAIVLFAAVIFLLFRGHPSGPQEAVAGDVPPQPQTSVAVDPAPTTSAPQAPLETTAVAATTPEPQEAAVSPEITPPAPAQTQTQPLPTTAVVTQTPPVEQADAPNPQAQAAITEALSLLQTQPGAVIKVRNKLNQVLQMPLSRQQKQKVKSEMAKLADRWLFGPAAFPSDRLCDTYRVRSGDVLDIIGRRLKVPYEFLMRINNIPRPTALQAGKTIKVVKGPFHVKVYRSTFTLDLYLQDTYVRSFKVGLGKAGYETPTGLWRVKEGGKLIAPDWTDPDNPGHVYKASDPDYPLGSRWIALDGVEGNARGRTGFAIHGTKDPEQIGTAGSRGCIRMYNGEAVLMYDMLVPLYSQVEVIENDN